MLKSLGTSLRASSLVAALRTMPRLVRMAERTERFAAFAFSAWRNLFKQDLFGGTIFLAATGITPKKIIYLKYSKKLYYWQGVPVDSCRYPAIPSLC
jgi:hypothetical protein